MGKYKNTHACKTLNLWPWWSLLLRRKKNNIKKSNQVSGLIYTKIWSQCESRSVVSNSLWTHGLYSTQNSPDQNTGAGSFSLLQGIFPTHGLNLGLPHYRWNLYQLSHKGSPLEWVAYPFSRASSHPRDWTQVSRIAGGFFTSWATREARSQCITVYDFTKLINRIALNRVVVLFSTLCIFDIFHDVIKKKRKETKQLLLADDRAVRTNKRAQLKHHQTNRISVDQQ